GRSRRRPAGSRDAGCRRGGAPWRLGVNGGSITEPRFILRAPGAGVKPAPIMGSTVTSRVLRHPWFPYAAALVVVPLSAQALRWIPHISAVAAAPVFL